MQLTLEQFVVFDPRVVFWHTVDCSLLFVHFVVPTSSAVTFIKETMSKSTPNMKALTSQGNLLSLLSLTSEELRDKVRH